MILIQFPDRDTEIRGLAVLMNRFSGKVLRGGLHIVPEPALEALTSAQIAYTVKGPATYEQEVAALRGDSRSDGKRNSSNLRSG
jgi:hypothetical protein